MKATAEKSHKLNQAQIAFLGLLANVTDEEQLDELRRVVARHLAQRIRQSTAGQGEKLGLGDRKGYAEFAKENHHRTPYKKPK